MSLQLDLLITLLSIYGWSWIITKSYLLSNFRGFFAKRSSPFKTLETGETVINKQHKLYKSLNYLVNCIVCTSFWITCLHIIFMKDAISTLVDTPFEIINLLGASTAIVWFIANLAGDAD